MIRQFKIKDGNLTHGFNIEPQKLKLDKKGYFVSSADGVMCHFSLMYIESHPLDFEELDYDGRNEFVIEFGRWAHRMGWERFGDGELFRRVRNSGSGAVDVGYETIRDVDLLAVYEESLITE